MSHQNQTEPKGIASALRKIALEEGDAAALKQANRWLSALEELHEVACGTMHTARPGGPQKLCTLVLLAAVQRYLVENPLFKAMQEAVESATDEPEQEKPGLEGV